MKVTRDHHEGLASSRPRSRVIMGQVPRDGSSFSGHDGCGPARWVSWSRPTTSVVSRDDHDGSLRSCSWSRPMTLVVDTEEPEMARTTYVISRTCRQST